MLSKWTAPLFPVSKLLRQQVFLIRRGSAAFLKVSTQDTWSRWRDTKFAMRVGGAVHNLGQTGGRW
jgi:hypothetical protein